MFSDAFDWQVSWLRFVTWKKIHADDHFYVNFHSPIAPVNAPGLVTAYSFSCTSLIVKWSHVAQEYFQGEPIGYEINYYPVNLELDVTYESVNYTTNTTRLSNLTVYTMYVINVSALSSGGIGPENTVKVRTDARGTNGLLHHFLAVINETFSGKKKHSFVFAYAYGSFSE